jgi:hypothetical protein
LTVANHRGVRRHRRERLSARAGRQSRQGPAGVNQQPRVIPHTLDPFAGARDDVEVLAQPENVEYGTEHRSTHRDSGGDDHRHTAEYDRLERDADLQHCNVEQ